MQVSVSDVSSWAFSKCVSREEPCTALQKTPHVSFCRKVGRGRRETLTELGFQKMPGFQEKYSMKTHAPHLTVINGSSVNTQRRQTLQSFFCQGVLFGYRLFQCLGCFNPHGNRLYRMRCKAFFLPPSLPVLSSPSSCSG